MDNATPRPDSRHALLGAGLVLIAAFGFSSKAILIKLAYAWDPGLQPIALMALRMGFALPAFLLVALWHHRKADPVTMSGRDRLGLVVVAMLGYYLASFLDFSGLQYISAGLERLILFLYPTLVLLLSALFLGRPICRREGFALATGYVGVVLVYGSQMATGPPGSQATTTLGAALVFGSALSFALFMMGSGLLIKRLGSVRFTAWSMSLASLATLLHFGLTEELSALQTPASVYALALLMAVASTVLPAFLMNAGIQRIGAGRASIISSGGPVMTLVLAWLVLSEALAPVQLAGTALVLVGVWVVGRKR